MTVRVTAVGNLTADPELRYTSSGAAVANFTVASTERYQKDGAWVDGETVYLRCSVWKEQAENVAASLHKGNRVAVSGQLLQRQYEHNGEKRTSTECRVDEVSASLRYAQARVARVERERTDPALRAVPATGTEGARH